MATKGIERRRRGEYRGSNAALSAQLHDRLHLSPVMIAISIPRSEGKILERGFQEARGAGGFRQQINDYALGPLASRRLAPFLVIIPPGAAPRRHAATSYCMPGLQKPLSEQRLDATKTDFCGTPALLFRLLLATVRKSLSNRCLGFLGRTLVIPIARRQEPGPDGLLHRLRLQCR